MARTPFVILMLWACSLAAGCTPLSLPQWSERLGLHHHDLASEPFALEALTNDAFEARQDGPVHVYLEGDGSPYLTRTLVAADPTPREPLMLQLMQRDPAPSVYLSRPCYFRASQHCDPALWTLARYGKTVLSSLQSAVNKLLPPDTRRIYIGYSGGGTLAVLLAARDPTTMQVITIAGNLDVGRWSQAHGFTPLFDSLDPAREPSVPHHIKQIHWIGEQDTNIRPEWTDAYVKAHPPARLERIPMADHTCCWLTNWSEMLKKSLAP